LNRRQFAVCISLFFVTSSIASSLPAVAVYPANAPLDLQSEFNSLAQQHGVATGIGGDPSKPHLTSAWQWYDDHPVWKSVWIQSLTLVRPGEPPILVRTTNGGENEAYPNAFTNSNGTFVAGTYQRSHGDMDTEVFLWDSQAGYRTLQEELLSKGVGDSTMASQVQFLKLESMTADGRYLLGTAWGGSWTDWAESPFLVDLGAPSMPTPEPTAMLCWTFVAAIGIIVRRRATA